MNDFFLYRTELTQDDGFQLFGICHLLWLAGIGIFSWYMGKFFSFSSENIRRRVSNGLGATFIFLMALRVMVLVRIGHYQPEMYGLHLCNLAVWLGAIYLWTKNRFVGVVFVQLCLPAAMLALIFPGWLCYPFWNFIHIHSFVYHGLVVAVGWCIIKSKMLVPGFRELWKPLLFGLVGYVVLSFVNERLDTNFWFLNKPSGQSPLAVLYGVLGEQWYLPGHFLFSSFVVILWTGFLHCFQEKDRKQSVL